MKTNLYIRPLAIFAAISILVSCSVFKSEATTTSSIVDPVCGMKVDASENFSYKYLGKKYYFDSYNCQQAFKMNPEKFINNSNKCMSDSSSVKK